MHPISRSLRGTDGPHAHTHARTEEGVLACDNVWRSCCLTRTIKCVFFVGQSRMLYRDRCASFIKKHHQRPHHPALKSDYPPFPRAQMPALEAQEQPEPPRTPRMRPAAEAFSGRVTPARTPPPMPPPATAMPAAPRVSRVPWTVASSPRPSRLARRTRGPAARGRGPPRARARSTRTGTSSMTPRLLPAAPRAASSRRRRRRRPPE